MFCPRCKVKMKSLRRSFHKKRKWVCPKCGRAKMESAVSVRRLRLPGD